MPLDYVVTPNGFFHPSCVVQLGEDDELAPDGNVRHADGSARKVAACGHASFDAAGHARTDVSYNGWIAYSDTDLAVTPVSNEMIAAVVSPRAWTSTAAARCSTSSPASSSRQA